MNRRRIAPTFMLPSEFPDPDVRDIYVVLRGGIDNVCVTSAQEFKCPGDLFYLFPNSLTYEGTLRCYRTDDNSLIEPLLRQLVERNNGFVDWTMVLDQGQAAYCALKEQLAGKKCMGAILRFTNEGELYLPRKEKVEILSS